MTKAHGIDDVKLESLNSTESDKLVKALSIELLQETYRPLPSRVVQIPKPDGSKRTLKIPAVRDRVVQSALKLIMEPVFEMDFQDGSFGYRPKRSAHDALEHIRRGMNKCLLKVYDLDLKSFFDTVRHDILLEKLAKRFSDDKLLKLCRLILKASGRRGLPQGSIVGPLWANVFLDELDRMLEEAQAKTKYNGYESVRYARFADDLVVLVSKANSSRENQWFEKIGLRISQILTDLDLTINEKKTKIVDVENGEKLDFLGYTFQMVNLDKNFRDRRIIARPARQRRTDFLRSIRADIKRNRFRPLQEVIKVINPRIRGWVNYFSWGHPHRDLDFVRTDVDAKIRKLATRQRKRKRGGKGWSAWSPKEIYDEWGLIRIRRSASFRKEFPFRAVS